MAKDLIDISIDEKEFNDALKFAQNAHDAIDSKWLKATQRRKLKPMVNDMKRRIHSRRLMEMISVTTAKKRAGEFGAKVGVVKNDTSKFPDFSAPALASVLEYGTGERFRNLKSFGVITGRQSTGRVKPKPALRPAWDANVKSFMDEVEDSIEKKVMKEA